MKIRKAGPVLMVLVAGGASTPVLADCCSSFLSCAATVVTEGVSCEVQTIIDTINALFTEVTNFGNDLTGMTSAKEQGARQYVSDTINNMQSQSQQSAADLAAALSQAKVLYQDETVIVPMKSATVNSQNLQAVSPTTVSGSGTAAGGAPASMTLQRSQALAPAATPAAPASPGNSMLQKSTVTAATAVQPSEVVAAAPHGAYADAFSRGVKQLTALQSTGSADLSKVNQYLAQAQSSEGPGVAAADTLAGVLSSPVTSILSQLSAMLTHPLDAFDPSSMVDDMEKSLTTAMSADIPQMIADITTGPQQAFDSSGPSYDDLQVTAEHAQQLAAAMANLYRERNATAANALYALLPQVNYAGVSSKATTRTAADFGQRLSYASLSTNNSAAKKKLLVVAMPASMAKIHTLVAQFKTQRAQGKAPIAQALMVNYNNSLSSQLNGYFSGKSPAAIASQRDQLIAQARTKYASDPTTANGVIALLNSEAAKRGAATNASATVTPIPGQPVPTLASQSVSSVKPQAGTVAPVNPAVPKSPAVTWGAAPAWTPAKTTTTLKTLQPVQSQAQQPAMQAAPSSLGR